MFELFRGELSLAPLQLDVRLFASRCALSYEVLKSFATLPHSYGLLPRHFGEFFFGINTLAA